MMKVFYVVVALTLSFIGYKGLAQKPMRADEASAKYSCVEFASELDATKFRETGVIPAGAHLSNKLLAECRGVRLDAKQNYEKKSSAR